MSQHTRPESGGEIGTLLSNVFVRVFPSCEAISAPAAFHEQAEPTRTLPPIHLLPWASSRLNRTWMSLVLNSKTLVKGVYVRNWPGRFNRLSCSVLVETNITFGPTDPPTAVLLKHPFFHEEEGIY